MRLIQRLTFPISESWTTSRYWSVGDTTFTYCWTQQWMMSIYRKETASGNFSLGWESAVSRV